MLIYHKVRKLFFFDSEIKFDSVPGTIQYLAMRLMLVNPTLELVLTLLGTLSTKVVKL